MNLEHKSNLRKALLSQTWNQSLAAEVIHAIEQGLKTPKPREAKSAIQLAIEKEKKNRFRSRSNISIVTEEE